MDGTSVSLEKEDIMIKISNATKKYGIGNATVFALNNVNLNIKEKEICVILGASGSGKSTLLNIIGGLDTLDNGFVEIENKNISNLKSEELTLYRRHKTGFVFQFYNLIQDLSVEENIRVASNISQNPLNVEEVLTILNINSLKNRFPNELSGGQQQKVSIARALIKNPSILLCDELTGALDSKSSKEVLKAIETINKKYGTTVLIITHNESILNMGDRVIKIKDGKIIENIEKDRIPVEIIEI